MKIILPNTLCEIDQDAGPLFFLAGPVRGGDDWQTRCCEEIRKRLPHFHAVLPCGYPVDHPLTPYRMAGKEESFDRQLQWERHYLDIAGKIGCIIFWLPSESKKNPRVGGGPYAMDTRGELGEWRGHLAHDPQLRVVIGGEPNFPGLSQIQRNYSLATGSNFPIHETLTETVAAAIAATVKKTR